MQYYVITFQNTALGPNLNAEYGDICAATEYFPQKFVGSFLLRDTKMLSPSLMRD